MVLLLGGVPVSDKVFKGGGYQNFTETLRGGGYQFFTHTKKETEQSKISLSRNFPTGLDAPFARFAPAATKSFRYPGGAPIFDSDSEGGYQYFTETPRGGMRFLWALFPKRTTLPPNKKF